MRKLLETTIRRVKSSQVKSSLPLPAHCTRKQSSKHASTLQSVSQSVSYFTVPPRARTPPPARSPAPPLPVEHKYRVLAPGGYSIVASEVNLSQRTGCSLPLFALYCQGGIVLGIRWGVGPNIRWGVGLNTPVVRTRCVGPQSASKHREPLSKWTELGGVADTTCTYTGR